jgi:hypothetical protein
MFDPAAVNSTTVTLEGAAEKLAVSVTVVRRLIAEKKVPAAQVIQGAPWEISMTALDSAEVRQEALRIKNRTSTPRTPDVERRAVNVHGVAVMPQTAEQRLHHRPAAQRKKSSENAQPENQTQKRQNDQCEIAPPFTAQSKRHLG